MKITKKLVINYTFITVGIVNLLALTGDTTVTWTSPMFMKLNSTDPDENPIHRQITETEQSWIGSIINIGAFIGPFIFGWIAHNYGRKIGLLSIAIPHLIAFLICAFPVNVISYFVGRFISGIAVSGGYVLLPMYVGEVAEDCNRGMLTVTLNIYWTFGNFFSLAVGPFMSATYFNVLLACFPICFFVLFLLFAPETPHYLIGANKIKDAENTLILLRSKTQVEVNDEIAKIKTELANQPEGSIRDLFTSKAVVKSLIISVVMIMYQQLSGINAVLYYTQPIFEISGSTLSSDINSVIVGVVIFSTSIIPPFTADRYGRRILLIISNIGIFLSLTLFGVYFYLYNETDYDTSSISFIPILALVLYLIFFNFGLSPIPWTLSSELFPANVKSVGAISTALMLSVTSFIITNFFNIMVQTMEMHGTFWLYAGFCLSAALFVFLFVPETRGKSFTEIQRLLEGRTLQWPPERING